MCGRSVRAHFNGVEVMVRYFPPVTSYTVNRLTSAERCYDTLYADTFAMNILLPHETDVDTFTIWQLCRGWFNTSQPYLSLHDAACFDRSN